METNKESNQTNKGSFECPSVNLIHLLNEKITVLNLLIVKQKERENLAARLDNSDVLREYKISRATAYTWRASGLAYTKIGSKLYYKREDIENFLKKYYEKAF